MHYLRITLMLPSFGLLNGTLLYGRITSESCTHLSCDVATLDSEFSFVMSVNLPLLSLCGSRHTTSFYILASTRILDHLVPFTVPTVSHCQHAFLSFCYPSGQDSHVTGAPRGISVVVACDSATRGVYELDVPYANNRPRREKDPRTRLPSRTPLL